MRVDEPDATSGNLDSGGSPVQPTYYYYDALSNLRRVDQGGQHRFFMYDSLSRLIRAKNPEQGAFTPDDAQGFPALTDSTTDISNGDWSVGYIYDPDGNLYKRRDARNVTTTYAYDGLNRNTTVAYTNDPNNTPPMSRFYDGAILGKGRPWYSSVAGATGSRTYVDEYDAAGRPKQQRQRFATPSDVGGGEYLDGQWWSPSYETTRTYDFAGDVLTQTYPSRHTVNYNYDAAGRLADYNGSAAFYGNLGDGTQRTYAGGVSYDEASRLQQEQFGTQVPLYHKLHYNVRGQLYDVRLSSVQWQTATGTGQWDWDRGALIDYYSQNDVNSTTNEGRASSGTENNGNLKRSDVYVPTADATYDGASSYGSYFTAQSTYSYDYLNRLTGDSEANYNSASGWGQPVSQGYSYDRWGNRTGTSASGGAPSKQFDAFDLANTNRLYAQGDSAKLPSQRSMRYDPAGNLTYDEYTGAGTRAYDAENRMISARGGDALTGTYDDSYVYDAEGYRTRRTINGVTTWQVYGFGGELVAEYAPNAAFAQPQKEYGYRGGELLVVASASSSGGWGAAPVLHDNPLVVGETTVQSRHITELRQAIDALRSHKGLSPYQWQADASVGALVKPDSIMEMRTALDQALGAPSGGYAAGLAQGELVRAVHIQEMRDRVLAAWQSGTGVASVHWLVTDHLGTPRMEADQTGSLTGISRHDYFPFGEEIGAGVGGRTQGQGYWQVDNVRQHFSGSERDGETGLDYMHARYYSSIAGRFTSVDQFDPILGRQGASNKEEAEKEYRAYLGQPQQWNRYSYAINNPLLYVDPSGEALQLSNDKAERERQMQALREMVGPDAAPYLYVNHGTNADGSDNYYVGIYDYNPNGDSRSFEQVNEGASELGSMIRSDGVMTLEFVKPGVIADDEGSTVYIGRTGRSGDTAAATGYFKGRLIIKMLDWSKYDLGYLPGEVMSNKQDNMLTPSVMMGHELEHGWNRLCGIKSNSENNQNAVNFENKIRKLQNPNGPTRLTHNPPIPQ